MANSSDSTLVGVGETLREIPLDCCDVTYVVVGQKLNNDVPLQNALKRFGGRKIYSDTGFEHMHSSDYNQETIFILDNFDGSLFQKLSKNKCRIVAPPVIIKCVFNDEPLPFKIRPLYNNLMDNVIICFSGFKVRDHLSHLADLVHRMGGSIRKDLSAKVTHLVANGTSGEKYRAAVSLGIGVMSEEWIHRCWDFRDDISVTAADEHLMQYKLNAFSFAVLSFCGFSKEETRHMEEVAIANGSSIADTGAPITTHLVVNDHSVRSIPFDVSCKTYVVKSEWFWASVQMDACADEAMYPFNDLEATPNSQGGNRTPKTLSGGAKNRRKRLRENLAQLASEGEVNSPACKRRSSGVARQSLSSSFLDATADTSAPFAEVSSHENVMCSTVSQPVIPKEIKLTSRQQTIMELYLTETNYVGILQTILKVFKEEIERPEQPGGPILDPQDCKNIFGGIPPIFHLHVKIRDQLGEITSRWSSEMSVGSVFLGQIDELTRLYPNFINYFEKTKEAIAHCDRSKPRFHAFLKLCQSKPECGRQTLTELLIRPVQRLPSITLLLKDILKRTETSDPDYNHLEAAIRSLEEVMMHINEDKRKAEGHQVMFEIINEIENCPANILSAHRCFIRKVDAVEVTEEVCGRGGHVTLFIFSDSIEICKRRTKLLSGKSPGALVGTRLPSQRPYKHLSLIQFSCIKRVVDICETQDCRNVFALITKKMDEKSERLCAFSIVDPTTAKDDVLTCISKAICTTMCRTDYESLLAAVESHALNLDASDLSGNRVLSRAASKLGKKVSRVFSMNRTPNRMKRAISSVTSLMSPMRRESSIFGLAPSTPGHGDGESFGAARFDDTGLQENEDRYSEIVDQMSIGTPLAQRRRETLAGISFSLGDGKPSQKSAGLGNDVFVTPRPVVGRRNSPSRHTPMSAQRTTVHKDFPSMQSLDFDSSSLISRTSSIGSCVSKSSLFNR